MKRSVPPINGTMPITWLTKTDNTPAIRSAEPGFIKRDMRPYYLTKREHCCRSDAVNHGYKRTSVVVVKKDNSVPPVDRKKLDDISSHAWEHPSDRLALNALQQIPGFDTVLRKVIGTFGERSISMVYQAQSVRVGPRQYPKIYGLLVRVCDVLDTEVPPLYVSQTPLVNAGAVGVDRPFIVLNSSLVEMTNEAELEVVIGHEVGHIMSEHALYRTLLNLLLGFGNSYSPMIGKALLPITLALLEWSRKAEVSCDRAGLLATQHIQASLSVQAVLAGGVRGRRSELDLDAFIEQSDEYRGATGLGAYYRVMSTLGQSHPFPVVRVAELRNWIDDGSYDKILSGEYLRTGDPVSVVSDASTVTQAFSDKASQVFEDSDRFVHEALAGWMAAAKDRLSDDDV